MCQRAGESTGKRCTHYTPTVTHLKSHKHSRSIALGFRGETREAEKETNLSTAVRMFPAAAAVAIEGLSRLNYKHKDKSIDTNRARELKKMRKKSWATGKDDVIICGGEGAGWSATPSMWPRNGFLSPPWEFLRWRREPERARGTKRRTPIRMLSRMNKPPI